MKRLVVLDMSYLVHRAYHAPGPNLTGPDGEPTRATYGFTQSLFQLETELRPDFLVVAGDSPRSQSKRRELFADYKAQRSEKKEDLIVQLKRCRDVVKALRVPVQQVAGWEADDVMATLAKQGDAAGLETILVTKDKDLDQCLTPTVRKYDVQCSSFWDVADVEKKWGFGPERVAALQALIGDTSDNIPGVHGVGLKGAVKLLQEYGTLKAIHTEAHAVQTKMKPKLAEAIKSTDIRTWYRLARMESTLEGVTIPPAWEGFDRENARTLFRALGFRRFSA